MRILILLASAIGLAATANAAELSFTPFHSDGLYSVGDQVGWIITPSTEKTPKSTYNYTIKTNQTVEIGKGSFDLSKGSATITATLNTPAMLYVTVDRQGSLPPEQPAPADVNKINASLKALLAKDDPALKPFFDKYPDFCLVPQPCAAVTPDVGPSPLPEAHLAVLGAAVSPNKIAPDAPRPTDFDAFWAGKLAELAKVPMRPVLTEVATSVPGIKLYIVQIDSLGSRVHGYLAVPIKKGPFPAMVAYQWAGVYALIPGICASRAAEGWLCLNVSSHDMPVDSTNGVPKNYYEIGNTSRDTSYFLSMYLRDTRALDWVRTLKSWNKKTLVVTGTSMGGHQSLVTAGLNPGKITAVVVNEPSGGDTNAELHGRKAAYPNWPVNDPKVAQTALYFDTVNFASKIAAPTLAAVGFIDNTCPPSSVLTAVNQIKAPKEIIPMPESDHNNYTPDKQGAFLTRSEDVFATLLHGGQFVPDQSIPKMK